MNYNKIIERNKRHSAQLWLMAFYQAFISSRFFYSTTLSPKLFWIASYSHLAVRNDVLLILNF